ncbi:tryptophan synthase beta subunit-like PLP-dependent enzyme, partial [Aspergillus cavernicola]
MGNSNTEQTIASPLSSKHIEGALTRSTAMLGYKPGVRKRATAEPSHEIRRRFPDTLKLMTTPSYRFGDFGGQFAPELQMDALQNLSGAFEKAELDETFWKNLFGYDIIRPSPLQLAKNLTRLGGGASIWLKREDLSDCGSENIRSIAGQILLAQRIGKTEIVTECGSARHGIA